MADNNRISIKKTSRVLAITCVAYTTVATILYDNYRIDLIAYSTPVILGTVTAIMSCAALQRMFCSLFTKNYLSFGCKELSPIGTIHSETNPDIQEKLPPTDNSTSEKQVESPYLKEYEAHIEELRRNEMEKKTAIVHAIHEYTTHEMSQFLSIDDLETLHENIESLAYGQAELYKPVRSKPDNQNNISLLFFSPRSDVFRPLFFLQTLIRAFVISPCQITFQICQQMFPHIFIFFSD